MELDVVVGELRTVQLHQGHAAEQGMGDAKRAWDAVNQAKLQSEADQKRFADELNHERQRCSSLVWCGGVVWCAVLWCADSAVVVCGVLS